MTTLLPDPGLFLAHERQESQESVADRLASDRSMLASPVLLTTGNTPQQVAIPQLHQVQLPWLQ